MLDEFVPCTWVVSEGRAIKEAASIVEFVDITRSWTMKSGQFTIGRAISVCLCFGHKSRMVKLPQVFKQVMDGVTVKLTSYGHN